MAQAQIDATNRLETEEEGDRDGPSDELALSQKDVLEALTSNLSDSNYNGLEESLRTINSTKLLIGVLGAPGVGKSKFINNMLGLRNGDKGAAKEGYGGKTKTREVYSHPRNPRIAFSDMPGFGTPKFKKNDAYLREMEVERHDFFLIFFYSTITEDYDWIIQKLLEKGIKFALVRTRADEMDTSSRESLQECMQEVKATARDYLVEFGRKDAVEIFVISNIDPEIAEFNELFAFIETNLKPVEQETMLIYVHTLTEEIIAKKEKLLNSRAWKVAGMMGIATGIPIPVIEIPINYALLESTLQGCLDTFGLNQYILERFPLEKIRHLRTTLEIQEKGFEGFINFHIAKAPVVLSIPILQNAIEISYPIIGSFITGTTAFAYYYNFLKHTIRKLARDARELRKLHIDSVV